MSPRRARPADPLDDGLAALELAIGIAIVLSFRPLVYLNQLTSELAPSLSRIMPEYLVYPIAGSLLAIFPTALLMGMAFPIGLRLWASPGGHTAERVGLFYSLNVAGAIVGSLAGGFLLLPRFGSEASLALLAAVSFCSGLALLVVARGPALSRLAIGAVAAAAFGWAVWTSPDPFVQFMAQRYAGTGLVWKQEGVEATVVVHELGAGANRRLLMTINGNHQAGTDFPTTFTHRRIGHLPMIVHPRRRTALVIGLGGGATAGAVSVHEGVDVDVVELADAVVSAARQFRGDQLRRPRSPQRAPARRRRPQFHDADAEALRRDHRGHHAADLSPARETCIPRVLSN